MEKYYSSDPTIQATVDKYRQYEGDQNEKYQQAKFGYGAGKWGFQGLKNSQYSDVGLDFAKFFDANPKEKIPPKMQEIMPKEGMDKLIADYETGGSGFLDIIRQAMSPDANITAARRFGKAGMEHYTEAQIAEMSGVAPAIAEGSATGAGALITESGWKATGTTTPGALSPSGPYRGVDVAGSAGTATGGEAGMIANEALAGSTAAAEGGLFSTMKAGAMANPYTLALMILLAGGKSIGTQGSWLQKRFNKGGGVRIPK